MLTAVSSFWRLTRPCGVHRASSTSDGFAQRHGGSRYTRGAAIWVETHGPGTSREPRQCHTGSLRGSASAWMTLPGVNLGMDGEFCSRRLPVWMAYTSAWMASFARGTLRTSHAHQAPTSLTGSIDGCAEEEAPRQRICAYLLYRLPCIRLCFGRHCHRLGHGCLREVWFSRSLLARRGGL